MVPNNKRKFVQMSIYQLLIKTFCNSSFHGKLINFVVYLITNDGDSGMQSGWISAQVVIVEKW